MCVYLCVAQRWLGIPHKCAMCGLRDACVNCMNVVWMRCALATLIRPVAPFSRPAADGEKRVNRIWMGAGGVSIMRQRFWWVGVGGACGLRDSAAQTRD